VLVTISVLAYRRRRQNPYLLAGWLWYLVTLLPVIGLIRSGPHSQADRYTYVPLVGVFIMIAWGAAGPLCQIALQAVDFGTGAALSILVCIAVSSAQVGHWKNTTTIFSHSVSVTKNNNGGAYQPRVKASGIRETDEAIAISWKQYVVIRGTSMHSAILEMPTGKKRCAKGYISL